VSVNSKATPAKSNCWQGYRRGARKDTLAFQVGGSPWAWHPELVLILSRNTSNGEAIALKRGEKPQKKKKAAGNSIELE
jgi:hypothetical protein